MRAIRTVLIGCCTALAMACAPAVQENTRFTVRGVVESMATDTLQVRMKSGRRVTFNVSNVSLVSTPAGDATRDCVAAGDRVEVTALHQQYTAPVRVRLYSGACVRQERRTEGR